jgi:glycine/D-amino acid oxidase-like deaminating enzyme
MFAHQWVLVGREADVAGPGDSLRVDVAGESVIVVRRDDGELGAFYNVCRHRGAELIDTCGASRGSFGALILYTMTSDREFVLDRLPDVDQVVVGLGAAHGFKFAAWFGRTLAALACGEPTAPELTPFAFERPSLHVPNSREAWLV